MKFSPQFRLAFGLVALLMSAVFVADLLGILPRPEDQVRESRRFLGESLAVQLSTAVARGDSSILTSTLEQIVERNDEVEFAGLFRADGRAIATYGMPEDIETTTSDRSTLDSLLIPILEGGSRWGEVRLEFSPSADWGIRFIGIPADTLKFAFYLGFACLLIFYLFMRKALSELNPSRAVPERVNAAFNVLAEGVLIKHCVEKVPSASKLGME